MGGGNSLLTKITRKTELNTIFVGVNQIYSNTHDSKYPQTIARS